MPISFSQPYELVCPTCTTPFATDAWVLVDAEERPDLVAALRDLTLHDLRRTFASALARQGRSAAFLQDVLGHQQASTTLAHYIGVYDEERTAATRDMDDWLAREIRPKRGRTYPCRLASP